MTTLLLAEDQVMLREAGFGKVETRESPHDPLNFYYIATKG